MKKYIVKINGKEYDVEVTEVGGVSEAPKVSAPVVVASTPAPQPKVEAPKPAAAPAAAVTGSVTVTAPMPGSIVRINVAAGNSVKKGDVLLVLEAMKMENEIVAPQDGVVASVNVAVGNAVNKGDVMVSLN